MKFGASFDALGPLSSQWYDSTIVCFDCSDNMITYNNCFVLLNTVLQMIVLIDDVDIIDRSASLTCAAMFV